MRISRDNEFAPNFNRENNRQSQEPDPSHRPWRPWEENGPRIPPPYDKLTLEKDMNGQDRLKLLAMSPKTISLKIRAYVRDRWPVLGSFFDRTQTWETLCFLKRKL